MKCAFDEGTWIAEPERDEGTRRFWYDRDGVRLVLDSLGFDPALYGILDDEDAVRTYYRDNFALQGIGIVACDKATVDGQKAVRTIGKKIESGQPAIYLACLAIPLHDRSFVLSLYAKEHGITGVRDTVIFTKHMTDKDAEDPFEGWAQDPYSPGCAGPSLRNLADSEEYDAMFPEHPLSLVRERMARLLPSVRIVGDEPQARRARWKFWP